MYQKGDCANCGGSEGIHHYKTMQCPVGGRESRPDHKQEYRDTTYLDKNLELFDEMADSHDELMMFLAEAHQPEVDEDHGGDLKADCSYCRAIATAQGIRKKMGL